MDNLGEGMKEFLRICVVAFAGSVGMTFIFLACALPEYNVWYPLIVILFYVLAPLPLLVACRLTGGYSSGRLHQAYDWAIFFTMFFIVSSFSLPILLARYPTYYPTIQWGACYLTMSGNVIIYITLLLFFILNYQDREYVW